MSTALLHFCHWQVQFTLHSHMVDRGVCRAGGRWLQAAAQSTPGRPLSVQIGSAAASAQPVEELEVFKSGVQGAMLEPSVANKNWVTFFACNCVCQEVRHLTVVCRSV